MTMTDTDDFSDDREPGPLGRFVRAFYDARRDAARAGDPGRLEPFIAADVHWREPDVGAHMGDLRGRDAVLDMIRRALATTGGTFDLRVTATVETGSHVAALIAWSAEKDGERIEGRELAVYEVRDGRIASAWFHPENIADDRVFWGEARP
ncbi:MAG: nuclear transport factor 2 family protein [Rhodospirillaceae bacterium]|nr:nuclear transport factor 2 family protein [Rhodospirillaceae bacterium]